VTTSSKVKTVLAELRSLGSPGNVEGMGRFGMQTEQRLGVSVPDMRKLARQLGRDHHLALALWKSGIQEARIVAGMVAEPERLTESQMESWVLDLDSWDVCDQLCMNLLEKSPLALKKIHDWSKRDEEFVKRAAYALLACLARHDKAADDQQFIDLLPLIERGATDERNFVKKAVNWALRVIGKRNRNLNREALAVARRIAKLDSKAARWIASDAIRELESEKIRARLTG
jgi:3-methyladenine DNA glycosylase AlkD